MSDFPDLEPQPAAPSPDLDEFPDPPAAAERPLKKPRESGASLIWETLQTLVLAGLLIVFFRAFIFQNFVVEGSSMYPTLMQGDRLIVSRLSYIFGEPDRGDIIVFQYPFDPQRDFVKRIIGLPGETVAIQNGQVFINGQPLPDEPYVSNHSNDNYGPVTLSEEEYFVLGDNRTGSSDSRSWGPLQAHFIIGKAWFIYYPFDRFTFIQHPDLELTP
jgi:signal peptidase I